MNQRKELQEQVAAKARESADFRAHLRNDPKAAIEQELGVTLPASLSIRVHEESATTAHLILPPAASLSENDLQAVAAGSDFVGDPSGVRIDYNWTPPAPPSITDPSDGIASIG